MRTNYLGKYGIFNIRSGKFYNSYNRKETAVRELAKLNKNGVKYEIYAPEEIVVIDEKGVKTIKA